ncbi:MAG TPA: DUF697 domain-containing protein [Xanthobacteraceae bacterium]|nr:DUF697 domain-containing protein [Xanthobacteraceae bacterium]
MRRKPLPKAITRSIANLQQIAAGFAADEQGRVPPHVTRQAAAPSVAFDAVEPEPKNEPQSMPDITRASQGADALELEPKARAADPLAARRRALARRIVDRHKNYAAMGGLVPLPAANIASVTAVNLRMVKRLSELYGVPFQRDRTRSLIIALIAGAVPTGAGLAASSTLMWIVPGGLVWGLGAAALTAGALTRGIGLVFVDGFEAAMAERSGP